VLSIYGNPNIKGKLSTSLYNSSLQMLLAHGCKLNGQLPSTDDNEKGEIIYATLSQNRISGQMPNNLVQSGNASNLRDISFSFTTTLKDALTVSFNVSKEINHGFYLPGNRFSVSRKWNSVSNNQELPDYVSKEERDAKNLYLSNETQVTEVLLIGCAVIVACLLFIRRLLKLRYCTCLCLYFRTCRLVCTYPRLSKLPKHAGFRQMAALLIWINNWFEIAVIGTLIVIYITNATLFEIGYPLSHVSFAYFENPSLGVTIILVLVVLLSNGAVLLYVMKWLMHPVSLTASDIHDHGNNEEGGGGDGDGDGDDDDDNSSNKDLQICTCQNAMLLLISFIGWGFSVTCVVIYFAFESLPENNTLHIPSSLLFVIQKIVSLVLTLHNSFIAPNFTFYLVEFAFYVCRIKNNKMARICRNFMTQFLRTLLCVVIPLILAFYFYNDCGARWTNYWSTCVGKDPNEAVVGYQYTYTNLNFNTTVKENVVALSWSDLCQPTTFRFGACIREILEKWGNVMVVKMAINIISPWISVLIQMLVAQIKKCYYGFEDSEKLNFRAASLFINVELVVLLGLFCPLIVPLCAMTIISNILQLQYLLKKKDSKKRSVYKLSNEVPPFPVSMLIAPFLLQQAFWVLSAAFSDDMFAHPYAVMNVFLSIFVIMDVCFIITATYTYVCSKSKSRGKRDEAFNAKSLEMQYRERKT
ncbi:hypothetical protein RFI_17073, partial [Reticulomyxa filosa]